MNAAERDVVALREVLAVLTEVEPDIGEHGQWIDRPEVIAYSRRYGSALKKARRLLANPAAAEPKPMPAAAEPLDDDRLGNLEGTVGLPDKPPPPTTRAGLALLRGKRVHARVILAIEQEARDEGIEWAEGWRSDELLERDQQLDIEKFARATADAELAAEKERVARLREALDDLITWAEDVVEKRRLPMTNADWHTAARIVTAVLHGVLVDRPGSPSSEVLRGAPREIALVTTAQLHTHIALEMAATWPSEAADLLDAYRTAVSRDENWAEREAAALMAATVRQAR